MFGVLVEMNVAQAHRGGGWRFAEHTGVVARRSRNIARRLRAITFAVGGSGQSGALRRDHVIGGHGLLIFRGGTRCDNDSNGTQPKNSFLHNGPFSR